jgi:hypothetical protein
MTLQQFQLLDYVDGDVELQLRQKQHELLAGLSSNVTLYHTKFAADFPLPAGSHDNMFFVCF